MTLELLSSLSVAASDKHGCSRALRKQRGMLKAYVCRSGAAQPAAARLQIANVAGCHRGSTGERRVREVANRALLRAAHELPVHERVQCCCVEWFVQARVVDAVEESAGACVMVKLSERAVDQLSTTEIRSEPIRARTHKAKPRLRRRHDDWPTAGSQYRSHNCRKHCGGRKLEVTDSAELALGESRPPGIDVEHQSMGTRAARNPRANVVEACGRPDY